MPSKDPRKKSHFCAKLKNVKNPKFPHIKYIFYTKLQNVKNQKLPHIECIICAATPSSRSACVQPSARLTFPRPDWQHGWVLISHSASAATASHYVKPGYALRCYARLGYLTSPVSDPTSARTPDTLYLRSQKPTTVHCSFTVSE